MTYTTMYGMGPEKTPTVIRNLIFATCGISIVAALTETLINQIFGWPGLQSLLSLSWAGIRNYFIWQPISYMFVQNTGSHGITLYFLIALAFNMYILWVMGTRIYDSVGSRPFLRFYFLCGLFAGILALYAMRWTGHYAILSSPGPSILAILLVWTMMSPDAELLLFFLIPIKAKWLMAGILGAIFLITLSQLDWIDMFFYLSGAAFGYLYAVLAWEFEGPFAFSHKFDHGMASIGRKFKIGGKKAREVSSAIGRKTKIFDIQTGEPLVDDDQFVDSMLAKISKKGEQSLSF